MRARFPVSFILPPSSFILRFGDVRNAAVLPMMGLRDPHGTSMRPLAHIAFVSVAVASLIASTAGWVQSIRRPRQPAFNAADHGLFIRSHNGFLSLTRFEPKVGVPIESGALHSVLGTKYRSFGGTGWIVAVPYWIPTLGAGLLVSYSAFRLSRIRSARRAPLLAAASTAATTSAPRRSGVRNAGSWRPGGRPRRDEPQGNVDVSSKTSVHKQPFLRSLAPESFRHSFARDLAESEIGTMCGIDCGIIWAAARCIDAAMHSVKRCRRSIRGKSSRYIGGPFDSSVKCRLLNGWTMAHDE